MGVALRLRTAVVGDVDLAAQNRLDSGLSGLPVELDRAGHGAVVGEPDRRHLELGGAGREGRDPAGPVEDRVLGVDVKVDKRRLGHGRVILGLGVDRILASRSGALAYTSEPVHTQSIFARPRKAFASLKVPQPTNPLWLGPLTAAG